MLIAILFAILIGILLGLMTGLTPGIHINLVATIIVASMPFLKINPLFAVILIISIAITHIFLDFIPTTFLGVPDSDNSIALLPSQELLLQGKAYESIFLSVIGCLSGIIIITMFTPVLLTTVSKIYSFLNPLIPYILILSLIILIAKEKNILWAIITILMSGLFGVLSFNLNIKEVLLPMFSGLFGISSIIISIKQKTIIPKQIISKIEIDKKKATRTILKGLFASLLVGFLPGLGSAQASVLATSFSKEKERKDYILLIGAINSIVMILALIALFTINKARNGAIAIISGIFKNLTIDYFILFLSTAIFISGIVTIITVLISKKFIKIIEKINYSKLSCIVILTIILLVWLISGLPGILLLVIATLIGLIPILKKVSRNHLMASLIIPIIFYYLL